MGIRRNIFIETSNFVGQEYIKYVVKEFGAERLILGSFMPVNDPLAAIGMLVDADIDEKSRQKIASGNIRQIVEGVSIRD